MVASSTWLRIAHDEDAALCRRELDLRERVTAEVTARSVGGLPDLAREPAQQLPGRTVVGRAREDHAAVVCDHGGFDLHGDLLEVGERFMPVHKHPFRTAGNFAGPYHTKDGRRSPEKGPANADARHCRRLSRFNARMGRAESLARQAGPRVPDAAILRRYFGARGPHLAAMLAAYYALLSLFPFVFLAASLVSWIGRPAESSALLRDLSHVLPGTSAHDLPLRDPASAPTPPRSA